MADDGPSIELGGPASQKLGAEGTGNLSWMLTPQLMLLSRLSIGLLFPMLRTQLEASCATP